eukprot:PhM_4_TR18887/c1_g1_i1/m.37554
MFMCHQTSVRKEKEKKKREFFFSSSSFSPLPSLYYFSKLVRILFWSPLDTPPKPLMTASPLQEAADEDCTASPPTDTNGSITCDDDDGVSSIARSLAEPNITVGVAGVDAATEDDVFLSWRTLAWG